MYILFDPNDSEEISKHKIEEFYGAFSDMVRAKLLAKSITRPSTVYDLLYPNTRESLLTKNVPNFSDLDKTSQHFRNLLLARNIENNPVDNSDNIRKSLLARNKISDSSDKLSKTNDKIREGLIAKNIEVNSNLLDGSNSIRQNNISKNSVSMEIDMIKSTEGIRSILLSKNNSKIVSILDSSKNTRDQNIAKNIEHSGDLLIDSKSTRDVLVARNVDDSGDLLTDSKSTRDGLIARNVDDNGDLLTDSKSTRDGLIAKNIDNGIDLLNDSKTIRDNQEAKNIDQTGDLLNDSKSSRDGLIAKNIDQTGDLLNDSKTVRDNAEAKNIDASGDLLKDSEGIRDGLIKKNVDQTGDLLNDSQSTRDGLIARNVDDSSDILKDSQSTRDGLIKKNVDNSGDLLKDSESTRDGLIKKNVDNIGDLLTDSKTIRDNVEAKNISSTSDLLKDSENTRDGLIKKNVDNSGDLLTDSQSTRDGLIKKNVDVVTDLLTDSKATRDNIEAKNTPSTSDLLTDSKATRDNVEAKNVPSTSDLLKDSAPARDGLEARNVPSNSDLLTDSKTARDNVEAKNIPSTSDLLTDSKATRDNVEAKNVPSNSDLLTDSKNTRDGLEARNIFLNTDLLTLSKSTRDGLEARNTPSTEDLLKDSQATRDNLIIKNIASTSNLLVDSTATRNNLLKNNVNTGVDLATYSTNFRNELLAKNTGGLIGVNIAAAGTSAFIGISQVLVQGTLYRALLLARNQYKKTAPYVDQMGGSYQNILSVGMVDKPWNVHARNYLLFQNDQTTLYNSNNPNGLLNIFGNGTKLANESYSLARDGKIYGDPKAANAAMTLGAVTSIISRYNQEKNLYNLNGNQPGGSSGYGDLTNFASQSPSLNDLIKTTVGSLDNGQGQIIGSPTTPASIVAQDGGVYMGIADPASYLKPQTSPDPSNVMNIVQHQGLLSSFDNDDFRTGKRGVRRVVNAIKNSTLPFAKNFDPQHSNVYVVGTNINGSPNKQIQRWTIANPYKAVGAQNLNLYFKNYSSNQGMFFPAYIQSFAHESSANWNEVNFLGRPEPLFTYNNSKRSGNITFFVLTDYAQSVDYGYNFADDGTVTVLTETFPKNFTDNDSASSDATKQQIKALQADNKTKQLQLQTLNQQISASQGQGETATLSQQAQVLTLEIANTNTRIFELQSAHNTNYYESSNGSDNVYNDLLNAKGPGDGGNITTTVRDTKARIDDMKQNLKFQPAFFSGDKVDFVNRIEFIEKMVRPSRNNGPGFSFINPPVCHMHLGNWINHDIIINNIAYDYTDALWTLDGSDRVQPLWAKVSINFNLVGIYRHVQADALTSTDQGGFFSDLMQDNTNS